MKTLLIIICGIIVPICLPACVTLDTSSGTYTVDENGCVRDKGD